MNVSILHISMLFSFLGFALIILLCLFLYNFFSLPAPIASPICQTLWSNTKLNSVHQCFEKVVQQPPKRDVNIFLSFPFFSFEIFIFRETWNVESLTVNFLDSTLHKRRKNGEKLNFILFHWEEESLLFFLKWTALKCDLLFVFKDYAFPLLCATCDIV